jgi:uncharacterized zinc-type alcohol dehydrogenase-like protein
MTTFHGYAAQRAGDKLTEFSYELDELGPNQVDLKVDACGICHSDLSMLANDWEISQYPLIPGHEVTGTVEAVGESVTHLKEGDKVGLGWHSGSCMTCPQCLSGDHNLCSEAEGTIIHRHGGFADRVRAESAFAVKIPDGIDLRKAGPLFCGGITVFNPLVQLGVRPTDRVAVVGIGGLGHLALQFLSKWGCEVTAISTSPEKEEEARALGAHHFLHGRDEAALKKAAGSFDLVLSTVNVELDWGLYVNLLGPRGNLHLVGAAPGVSTDVFSLIMAQRAISASPVGSPATIATMLDFCSRHGIAPLTREFPMKEVNDALKVLQEERPAKRLVLVNSFEPASD